MSEEQRMDDLLKVVFDCTPQQRSEFFASPVWKQIKEKAMENFLADIEMLKDPLTYNDRTLVYAAGRIEAYQWIISLEEDSISEVAPND